MKIGNFKVIEGEQCFTFSTPTGDNGSGINVFVGDNNTGKSTVFEAFNFLRNSTPRHKTIDEIRTKGVEETKPVYVEVTFTGEVSSLINNLSKKKLEAFILSEEETNEEKIIAVRSSAITYYNAREKKEIEELNTTSKIFLWNFNEERWENPSGIDSDFKKFFEAEFVWADTNPDDIADFGSTKICGNLLQEIANEFFKGEQWKKFREFHTQVFYEGEDSLKNKVKEIEEQTQNILSQQFGEGQISFEFDLPDSSSFFKSTKINMVDSQGDTPMAEKGSGMQRSVALALLQVYAEKITTNQDEDLLQKPFFLFIDEPELCHHPKAQFNLAAALSTIAKEQQVFIATHSPYFLRENQEKIKIFLFQNKSGNLEIIDTVNDYWGVFPWSPSWGEINYFAYELPTVEFHNELYGFLEGGGRNGELVGKLDTLEATESWYNDFKKQTEDVSLPKYIRNAMHHPENRHNPLYDTDDIEESIKIMLDLIK
jgi:AAA15 family ATPase/GTPase